MVALQDANGKRHVAHAQARVAEAFDVVLRPTQPATEKPEQTQPRIGQVTAMHGTQRLVGRFEVHEIVEALGQCLDAIFAADDVKGGDFLGRTVFDVFLVLHLPILP